MTIDSAPGGDDRPTDAAADPSTMADRGSFDSFFADHHDDLVRALAVTLGDDHLGRDAASEGFARALQRWRRVSGYENPAGWVYRVGLNWARSRRRKTVREVAESAATGRREPVTEIGDVDPRLVAALRRLSVDHRAVVVGRYYLDWSEARLAEALGVRPGTVKSRLSRALAQLGRELGAGT